jgi:hypothetical protein
MRRILIVLLAIVLPLQFAWAGAAAYCGHEPDGVAAGHFGHHSHAHHGDGQVDRASDDPAGSSAKADSQHGDEPQSAYQAPDLDCAVCHLAASAAVPSVSDLPQARPGATSRYAPLPALFRSAPDALPDRPQWSRLA